MRRFLFTYTLLISLLFVGGQIALAQTPEAQPSEEGSDPADSEEISEGDEEDPYQEEDEEVWDEEEEPQLRAPDTGSLALEIQVAPESDEEDLEDDEDDDELPSPTAAQARLEEGIGDGDPTVDRWSTPQSVVDLHGYMRFRGEFQDNFFVDRILGEGPNGTGGWNRGTSDLPFGLFRPAEDGRVVPGGCGGDSVSDACQQHANAFANMRLRLEPTIHLSDDVRVHMQLDVFDNMVLGSTPNSLAVGPAQFGAGDGYYIDPYYRYERTTMATSDFGSTTAVPSQYGRNSLSDSIMARRAWAEVRNRGLGELRFGRMGAHWGLGLLHNGGSGIDADYQTDVDRIMLISRLAGIYFFGAWDFGSEGLIYQETPDLGGVAYDRSRIDDVDQFVLGAAYRATDEEREAALQRGDAVFNAGAYFVYRSQNLSSAGTRNPFGACVTCGDSSERSFATAEPVFVRRGAESFVPDLWMQFLYEKLRVEMEAAFVYGTIENLSNTAYDRPGDDAAITLMQFGLAFESEYHLLNDQLGIYFYAGYASGDADVEGLSRIGASGQLPAGPPRATVQDRTDSTFYFHPNYRVDLIFWRNMMRQVGGGYYLRPGMSYDFIKNSFGQLLGARADVVWSRASQAVQSWGNSDDLGVEIDVNLYYRSEDGPDVLDGFYAMAQWGIFFPLDGLGYTPGTSNVPSQGNAQTFRLVLGVQY